MIYQVDKKQCSNSGRKRNDIDPPGKWFYGPTPLPSQISWASDRPIPLEFPIRSVVGVWIFSGTTHYIDLCDSRCLLAKGIEKKPHITQTIICRLIVSVLQMNSVFSRFLLLSSFNSKSSVNPSWVKWCIFKTSQRSYSLERAQEVKFFPQWSSEGQKSVMSMSSDICNFCTCATGCQKFSDIR